VYDNFSLLINSIDDSNITNIIIIMIIGNRVLVHTQSDIDRAGTTTTTTTTTA
jgi:hypothetical protein